MRKVYLMENLIGYVNNQKKSDLINHAFCYASKLYGDKSVRMVKTV